MLLVVGTAGGATGVSTGIVGEGLVVGAPLLTEFCAAVMPVAAIGFKIPAFVGTHSLTRTVSSALVKAANCDTVSRNSD